MPNTGLPAHWHISREAAPDIAEFLNANGAHGVAEAILRALDQPPDTRAFIEDVASIAVWLSAEEATQVWELYENGREVSSAPTD